jgi:hypothetical protein
MNVNFSRMKVLIQNPENSLYLESLDRWCPNVNDAYDFGNSDHAIQFCVTHGIAPINVVLQWSGMPYTIAIPIAAAHQHSDREKNLRARKHA